MARKKQALLNELNARLIRDIRHGRANSRLELAKRHKIAPSTMGIHIDRLIESGHLAQELPGVSNHRGRPIQRLGLRGEVGVFIGAEFEARTLHAVCTDFAGKVIERRRVSIAPGATSSTVLAVLDDTIGALHRGRRETLLGIGIGTPGLIDPDKGIALHYRFIEGWKDVPVVTHLREKFSVPVALETNVRATALGIHLYEKSFAPDDFICLVIRSGVGAGIVRQGTLHAGENHTAGEIGRIVLPGSNPTLTVEDLCALPAIFRYAGEHLPTHPSSLMNDPALSNPGLVAAVKAGDTLAIEAVRHAAHHLGWACHVLALVENPRTIVVTGPLAELGDWFRQELEASLVRHATHSHIQLPQIAVTTLGESVGALGAASLAIEAWKP